MILIQGTLNLSCGRYKSSDGRHDYGRDIAPSRLVRKRGFSKVLLLAQEFSSLWANSAVNQGFKITRSHGDRTLQYIIIEWLRSCSGRMLFRII